MSSTAKQIRAVALKIHFSQMPAFSWNQSKAVYLAVCKNNFKIQGTLSQCGCPFLHKGNSAELGRGTSSNILYCKGNAIKRETLVFLWIRE